MDLGLAIQKEAKEAARLARARPATMYYHLVIQRAASSSLFMPKMDGSCVVLNLLPNRIAGYILQSSSLNFS